MTPAERLALPMPKLMRTLPRDERGYPIPWIVLVDASGNPQFTINDVRRTDAARKKRLCAICGKRMAVGQAWFIGGSRCFLHPRGAFIDGPTHYWCGEYALQVCPFLAARSYAKPIVDAKLKPSAVPIGMALARAEFMMPRLPERFGFGRSDNWHFQRTGIDDGDQGGVYVVNDWRYIEWWRRGTICETPETGTPPPDDAISPGGTP